MGEEEELMSETAGIEMSEFLCLTYKHRNSKYDHFEVIAHKNFLNTVHIIF